MAEFKGDANPKRQAEGIMRIEKVNKELEALYPKYQKLENGVEMPGTYVNLGIGKGDILKFIGKA